jgi:hypothetical protein
MPVREDLSPYATKNADGQVHVYVGWIDPRLDYPHGIVDPEVVRRIGALCDSSVRRTRGWHSCALCREYPIRERIGTQTIALGDAEIDVPGEGKIYACPTLIYHYILRHRYCPPEEFLDAVRALSI